MVGKYTDQKIADLQERVSQLEWHIDEIGKTLNNILARLNQLEQNNGPQ